SHVVAANEGNVVAKLLPVQVHQALPVARFLGAHAVEHGGGGRKILAKTFGKIRVDALILFLERDGQGQDLAFRKAVKVAHVRLLSTDELRARFFASLRMTWRVVLLKCPDSSSDQPQDE